MNQIYNHDYDVVSVYGHVIQLLRNHALRGGVLLDLGCGYGSIAEPVRDDLGLTYVGFDLASDGLDALRRRGFEAHAIDLSDPEAAEATILGVLAGRPLAGLTLIDTLEHLLSGLDVLRLMRRLAGETPCPLVISVPNVAHNQIAVKLLLGRWEMTEAGLLDHTHVGFFTAERLNLFMRTAGWRQVESNDFKLETSDQFFPTDALPLLHSAPLGHFLRRIVDGAHAYGIVNQFVRAYSPTSPQAVALLADRALPIRPFLTVVLRTAGLARLDDLRGVLDALAAQTCADFDVRLVIRRGPDEEPVRSLVAMMPAAFQSRVTLLHCDHDAPADAYNAAIPTLQCDYVAFLDDDTLPMQHWVETFYDMAASESGRVLQTGCQARGGGRLRATDLVETLFGIGTPLPGLAFPISAFRDLGLRFDASMPVDEDRDFVAGAAQFCSLCDRDTVTVTLRRRIGRLRKGESTDARLLRRLNDEEVLLPAGTAMRIERMRLEALALPELRQRHGELNRGEAWRIAHPMQSLRGNLAALHQLDTNIGQLALFYSSAAASDIAEPLSTELFLSVITRTRGVRLDTLRDMLLCLSGQTCQDFEVVIVLHKCPAPAKVAEVVDAFPAALRQRIRLIQCDTGGRAAPLNAGVEHARGNHVAFVDDDDFVFGHWVETFKTMAEAHPGKLLRTVCARQDTEQRSGSVAESYAIASSWFNLYPTEYDLFAHFHHNETPFLSLCFPAFVFRNVGLRFDDSLSTTEDWELSTRVALLCGVHASEETTSVYRWWTNAPSSMTEHDQTEWENNRQRIIARLNAAPLLMSPGTMKRIIAMVDENRELIRQRNELTDRLPFRRLARTLRGLLRRLRLFR